MAWLAKWKRLLYTAVATTVCAFLSWVMILGAREAWPQIVDVLQYLVGSLQD